MALAHEYEAERGERARDVTPVQQQLEPPQASAPRGWSQQFAPAGGNGHSGDPEPEPEQPEEPPVPRPPTPPQRPPMPPDVPPVQTAEPSRRSPGRPKGPDRIARDIISRGRRDQTPNTSTALLAHHEEAIAALPDQLRTEVVTAAQDRRWRAAEGADDSEETPDEFAAVAGRDGRTHGAGTTRVPGRRQTALAGEWQGVWPARGGRRGRGIFTAAVVMFAGILSRPGVAGRGKARPGWAWPGVAGQGAMGPTRGFRTAGRGKAGQGLAGRGMARPG